MKAHIEFNEDGYIKRFETNNIRGEYDVPEDFDFEHLHCYHLVNKILTLDTDKVSEQDANEEKESEIYMLREKLKESDYVIARTFEDIMSLDNTLTFIADFIKILKSFKTKYADVLANRKAWRDRIEELEGSVSAH